MIDSKPVQNYNKRDAKMTRGYAILSMCVLHLFCRLGDDIFGTPLIWISEGRPLVYWFGFFAEICMPTYALCVGYAQTLMDEAGKLSFKTNAVRIKNLMINYWIILALFSVIGFVSGRTEVIPQSLPNFLKSIVLLHSYNGAWWFLNTYILILVCYKVFQVPVKKLPPYVGIIACFIFALAWYLAGHFHLIPVISDNPALEIVLNELRNLANVLPYYWIGGFLCKQKIVSRISKWLSVRVTHQNLLLTAFSLFLFIAVNILSKAVFAGPCAVVVFITFNLMHKAQWIEKLFIFLGEHSTNIWLTHMFFYAYIFPGLVQRVKYPLFMLLFMLLLCICTSYAEKGIVRLVVRN